MWRNHEILVKILRTARGWSGGQLEDWDAVEEEADSVTFTEFLTMVAGTDTDTEDQHWKPWFLEADPCLLHYDYIGYIEDMEASFKEVKDKVFSDLDEIQLSSSGMSGLDVRSVIEAYKHVPGSVIQAIHQDFEDDFLIGGYNSDINCISL